MIVSDTSSAYDGLCQFETDTDTGMQRMRRYDDERCEWGPWSDWELSIGIAYIEPGTRTLKFKRHGAQ
jgi:hypothetical protein